VQKTATNQNKQMEKPADLFSGSVSEHLASG
jgi:hypothetical protein